MDPDPTLLQKIAKESGTSPKQVEATLDLLEKQAAIPFIARYRKEATGNLDEPRIRRIAECHGRYRAFLKRRRLVLSRIEDQDKLSDELKEQILACYDKNRLEDLYAPFKRKERKEASAAREKGLESLAKQLWEQETGEFSIDAFSEKYLSEEKGVATKEEAIEGALAIVARWVADDATIRGALRRLMSSEGKVVSKVVEGKAGEKTKYDSFYDFREEISRIPFHRVTALRRGVREGILTLEIELDDQKALQVIRDKTIRQSDSPCVPFLERAIRDAYLHSLKPLLQAEVRSNLKERTDNEALKLFQANLANLLLAPPLGSVAVMGMDPGARSACRITVIDANGAYREHATLSPGLPRKNSDRAEAILYRLIQRHGAHAIAIGNGVGSRETERFVRSFLTKYHAGHAFDLSLVRGKTAKPETASKKEADINGRAESEPSGLAAGSRPPSTEAAEEPNSPREESLPEANLDEAGAVSAPIQENAGADTNRESAAVQPSSEEVSAPTASTAAEGAESPAGENSHQNGDPNSASPVEDGSPEATEVSALIQENADADTNRESAAVQPSSEEVSAPTVPTAAEGAESPAGENSHQNGDPNSASPVEDGSPEATEVSAPIQENADADTNRESAAVRPSSEDDSAPTTSTAAEGAESPAGENSHQNGDPNSASPVEDGSPEATEVSAPIQENADADTNRESAAVRPSSEDDSAPTTSTAAEGAESPAGENSHQNGDPNSASPVEDGTPEGIKAAPTPTASESPRSETTPSPRPSIFSAIVHKGGTAAYASSEAARKEFPRLDLGFRGAVSIARRMQDPLAELAKIQPKAILAGSDLREVEPKRLKRTLEGTLESCINQVGLDVNTAPVQLLARVAGLNSALARSIVEHRRKHGPFSSRSQLMEVPGITEARFEQSAGFLRVLGGEQPLDGTAIHPECYDLVEAMAGSVQATVAELFESPEKLKALDLEKLSNDRFGLPTLQDIRRELSRRGRDRRKAFVPPSFREDVKEVSDLQKGMLVEGTVSNVTSFGAFVDIGVQQEGLVHISELSNRFVRDANQAVHVGQVVKAKVIGVDAATNRISLSIKALRVSENSRKRKKKPLKTASRPPAPKPKHASAGEKGNHQEIRRSGRPERRPSGPKGRPIKKRPTTAVKTTAIRPKRPKPPEADVLPDTSNLSFSEKIRLLQEKFSGIR